MPRKKKRILCKKPNKNSKSINSQNHTNNTSLIRCDEILLSDSEVDVILSDSEVDVIPSDSEVDVILSDNEVDVILSDNEVDVILSDKDDVILSNSETDGVLSDSDAEPTCALNSDKALSCSVGFDVKNAPKLSNKAQLTNNCNIGTSKQDQTPNISTDTPVEALSNTSKLPDMPVTKRGITLSDDDDDLPILPQAAIFSSCITKYRNTLKQAEKYMKANDKDDSTGKINAAVTTSDNSADEETVCSLVKLSKISPSVSKKIKAKLSRIRRNINKDRMKNKRFCTFTLPVEVLETNDDDQDDNVECLNEEDNSEISVKIRYKRDLLRFPMKRTERFSRIFLEIAKKYNLNAAEIMLCREHDTINIEDTPAKLNLSIVDILDCCLWSSDIPKSIDKQNWVTVKVQSNDMAARSEFNIHKLEPISVLMKKYAEQRGIPLEKMIFLLDGEKLTPTDNPIQLELENGFLIDVKIL